MRSGEAGHALWEIPAPDAFPLTALRARDLIVDCFFHAQRETFLRTKQRLGSERLDDDSIRADLTGVVRIAFTSTGGDFDAPTPESLRRVLTFLGRNAAAWGTPPEIVAHHSRQIRSLIDQLTPSGRSRAAERGIAVR